MLLVNNTFPCDDALTGWTFRVGGQSVPGTLYVAVWRTQPSGNFLLVHKTLLTSTKTGYFQDSTYLDTPIHVRKGDFLGIHWPTSGIKLWLQTRRNYPPLPDSANVFIDLHQAYTSLNFRDDQLPVGKQLSPDSLTSAYHLFGIMAIMKRPCKKII